MSPLTEQGQRLVADIAQRYNLSTDAVLHMLIAVNNGNGTQAQFNLPELGGMGQWSIGGMTMVGDMFNNGLKATVDALCNELSQALGSQQVFEPYRPAPMGTQSQSQGHGSGASLYVQGGGYGNSWPPELGTPSSTGAQNNLRYAVFPQTRRLAIDFGGRVEVYDTGDHQIGGVGQQQSGDQSLTFTSQYGLVRVADLPRAQMDQGGAGYPPEPSYVAEPAPAADMRQMSGPQAAASPNADEILSLIGKLADLKSSGILSDAEFEAKKSELLSRL